MTFKRKMAVLLGAAALAIGTGTGTVQAEQRLDIQNPIQMFAAVAAERSISHVSGADADYADVRTRADHGGSDRPTADNEAWIETPAAPQRATKVELPREFTHAKSVGEYEVFATTGKSAYIAATDAGAQVVFAATSMKQLEDLSVTLGTGITSHEQIDEYLLLQLDDGSEIAIAKPWATDAKGRDLKTWYTVAGDKLVQHVEANSHTQFPVLADPNWTYTMNFNIGNTTRTQAKNMLKSCFNCKFPVQGAPRAFPKPGQHLPLYVGFPPPAPAGRFNFNCTFDTEFSGSDQGGTYWGYRFDSAPGHIDGPGSHINFSFRSGSINRLTVFASIRNPHPGGIPQPVYLEGARFVWSMFALRMRT